MLREWEGRIQTGKMCLQETALTKDHNYVKRWPEAWRRDSPAVELLAWHVTSPASVPSTPYALLSTTKSPPELSQVWPRDQNQQGVQRPEPHRAEGESAHERCSTSCFTKEMLHLLQTSTRESPNLVVLETPAVLSISRDTNIRSPFYFWRKCEMIGKRFDLSL